MELDLKALAYKIKDENKVSEFLKHLESDALAVGVMTIGAYGNVFIRPMKFDEKNRIVEGHVHHYDHTTIWVQGAVNSICWMTDNEGRRTSKQKEAQFKSLAFQNIPKRCAHSFHAITKNALGLCVFSHRDYQGNVTDTYNGNMWAYE